MKNSEHCCSLMSKFTKDERVGISYNLKYREYTIDLLFSPIRQAAFYCPFCGTKLPMSLVDTYFDIIKKKYNIDDPYREEQFEHLPEEFKSDEWWKNRGL